MTATLYRIKPRFQARLRPVVERLHEAGVKPNHLTMAAIGLSAAAGGVVAICADRLTWLWAIPVFYLVRMALNAMDGMLAREYSLVTRRGDILNEVGDVVSDALAYLPFALLVPNRAWLIVTVVVLGLIGEITALAAAESGERHNHGPLGKSDRALAFAILAITIAVGLDSLTTPLLTIMATLGAATIWNRATHEATS